MLKKLRRLLHLYFRSPIRPKIERVIMGRTQLTAQNMRTNAEIRAKLNARGIYGPF